MDDRVDGRKRLGSFLRGFLLLGFIVLVWAAALRLLGEVGNAKLTNFSVDNGSLVTVLFGASSIALFMLSMLAAVFAIFGWQALKDHVKERVEVATTGRLELLENELRGRILTNLGYVVGEMCVNKLTLGLIDEERDRLAHAIYLCQEALVMLQKVPDGKSKFLGLNNLVYYSCIYGDKSRERYLLEQARLLRDEAQKHDAVNLQLTACRVFLEFDAKPHEKRAAQEVLKALVARKDKITARERREAEIYLRWARQSVLPDRST